MFALDPAGQERRCHHFRVATLILYQALARLSTTFLEIFKFFLSKLSIFFVVGRRSQRRIL